MDIETARSAALFRHAPATLTDSILSRSSGRLCHKGMSLFLQGEPSHSVFILTEGWVKLFRITPCGSEAVVGVVTRGGSFGENEVLRSQPYGVGAEVVTDAEVVQIDAATLRGAVDEEPALSKSILGAALSQIDGLIDHVEQLKAHTGAQRIADFLLDLAPVSEGPCVIILPYDKVLIAGRVGMKPESLSRAFTRLRGAGVTVKRDKALIEDIDRLAAFADEDPAEAWSKQK